MRNLPQLQSLPMPLLHSLLILIMIVGPSLAAIANRTLDDTRGDSVTENPVIYQGMWNSKACPQCLIHPDPAQAFDGTWTETTHHKESLEPVNATLKFTGTAIYVFFILANNAGSGITSKTAANFTLDNQSPLLFEHIPDLSTSDLQYNALVFSQDNLENIDHSLVISVSSVQEEVYVNFDYAIYTHEDILAATTVEPAVDPPIPTSSHPKISQPLPDSPSSIESATGTFPIPLTTQLPPNVPSASAPLSTPPALVLSIPALESSTLTTLSSATDIGVPSEPSQTSNTGPPSQRVKSNIPTGVIAGGGVGGLVILSLLIFGIVFIRSRRRRRHRDSTINSADLLYIEDRNSASYINAGIRNIGDGGIDTNVVPFPLGPPTPEQAAGTKPSETAVMSARGSMQLVTLPPEAVTLGGVTRGNSDRQWEDLRRARQEELDQRLQATNQEMMQVLQEINNRHASQQMRWSLSLPGQQNQRQGARNNDGLSTDGQISVDELQETLRHIRWQIEHLQQQQHSAWARGLSDDPPPGYTTDTRV